MKISFRVVCVIVLALAAGCAGGKPRPQEVSQAQAFDAAKYLTAEATGQTEIEARREAMAALAAVFQARVQAETQSRANSYLTTGESEQFEKQVDQMVQIETDVQLQGARIGWARPDAAAGGFRALAVLDRDQAAGRWRSELERIEMALDAGMQSLSAAQGRLPRLIALNHMAVLASEMAVTESRLSVLGRPGMPSDLDLTPLLAERERLAQDAAFFIQIEGEPAELFRHRLGKWITAQGYKISKRADEAAGLISGKVWFQPLALDNAHVAFVRALADIVVIDRDSDREIVAFSENSRKGHIDENEARRRALDQLAEQTAAKITRTLGTIGLGPVIQSAESP